MLLQLRGLCLHLARLLLSLCLRALLLARLCREQQDGRLVDIAACLIEHRFGDGHVEPERGKLAQFLVA